MKRPPKNAWPPGVSGNPKGRPKGAGRIAEMRASIAEHIPDILGKLTEQAKAGDVAAARVLLERAVPALRAAEHAQPLTLPDGSLTDQGRAVLRSVASGELAPGQGAQLLAAIAALGRTAEIDEIARRLDALEQSTKGGSNANSN